MRPRRLLRLAALLEKDAASRCGVKFNMGTWGYAARNSLPSLSCGTEACAIGVAVLSGEFNGLTYGTILGTQITPLYRKWERYEAVEKYFDLSFDHARYLFSPSCYLPEQTRGGRAERYVAQRIRDFVKERR